MTTLTRCFPPLKLPHNPFKHRGKKINRTRISSSSVPIVSENSQEKLSTSGSGDNLHSLTGHEHEKDGASFNKVPVIGTNAMDVVEKPRDVQEGLVIDDDNVNLKPTAYSESLLLHADSHVALKRSLTAPAFSEANTSNVDSEETDYKLRKEFQLLMDCFRISFDLRFVAKKHMLKLKQDSNKTKLTITPKVQNQAGDRRPSHLKVISNNIKQLATVVGIFTVELGKETTKGFSDILFANKCKDKMLATPIPVSNARRRLNSQQRILDFAPEIFGIKVITNWLFRVNKDNYDYEVDLLRHNLPSSAFNRGPETNKIPLNKVLLPPSSWFRGLKVTSYETKRYASTNKIDNDDHLIVRNGDVPDIYGIFDMEGPIEFVFS